MNAVTAFDRPLQQTYQMETKLKQSLRPDVAEEIIAYTKGKATEKYNQIYDRLLPRLNKIDLIYETDTESKEEYIQRMQQFLTLTNPKDLAQEWKSVLTFDEIEKDYRAMIDFFSKEVFGSFYLRYQFDHPSFKGLTAGILSDISMINESIEDYAQAIGDHLHVLESIRSSAGGKAAVKIGTKIAASIVAGPFGSLAAGSFTNAVMNDDGRISDSYGRVLDQWNLYLNEQHEFLKRLAERYEHILISLVGGLFLRVSEELEKMHVTIGGLALLEYGIHYQMEDTEIQRYEIWMTKTLEGIVFALRKNHLDVGLKAANELFEFVNKQPLLKYETYQNKQCYLYVASLYKVAAITTYAWSVRSAPAKFQTIVRDLFQSLPVSIKEEDLVKLGVPTQLELSIVVVSQWLEKGLMDKYAVVIPRHLLTCHKRTQEIGYFEGEPLEDDIFIAFGVTIGKYLSLNQNMQEFDFFVKKVAVTSEKLKQLIKTYKALTGKDKDDLLTFMKDMIFSRRISLTVHYLKKPFVYIPILLFILGAGIWVTKDKWLPKFEPNPSAISEPAEVPITIQKVEIITSGANVRSEASLGSSIVTAVSAGETYEVLDEQLDSDGRKWYNIQVSESLIGWVSEKVVTVIEQN